MCLCVALRNGTEEMKGRAKLRLRRSARVGLGVLEMIQDGTFNDEWIKNYQNEGKAAFDKYMKELDNHQIEVVGKQMRKMMWPDSTE